MNPPRRKELKTWQAGIVGLVFVAIPTTAAQFEWGPHILLGGIVLYVSVCNIIYSWRNRQR